MSSSDSGTPESWITSFCALLGHEYFAEVSEEFIEDDFNLTGLQNQVPNYKEALETILDVEPEEDSEDDVGSLDTEEEEEDAEELDEDEAGDAVMRGEDGERITYRRGGGGPSSSTRQSRRNLRHDPQAIEASAELLYGLIHQRYITSRPGIQQMADKYELQHFGSCPRVMCNQARVLPVGISDVPGQETVKLFCPSCLDVYVPPNSRFQSVDGAFFGTTFGCLFFMTFPDLDVSAVGDPLRLASTNPVFGLRADATPVANGASSDLQQQQQQARDFENDPRLPTKSRSSSLSTPAAIPTSSTSNNNPPQPSGPQLPPELLPDNLPPDQPSIINGFTPTNLAPGLGPGKIHESKCYGFRVSEVSRVGPRMRWLRERPVDIREMDEGREWRERYGGDGEDGFGGGGVGVLPPDLGRGTINSLHNQEVGAF